MRRTFLWIAALAAAGLVVLIFVRGAGISARREPWPLETRVARGTWRFLIPSAIRSAANPVPETPELLEAALEHFADHCAICHANNGSGDTVVGRNVFPPAPDLRDRHSQDLTDGELFYAIDQGIPWTAMPAWGNGTPAGERSSWELVRFIRHLPRLSPAELQKMEQMAPRSPQLDLREKEINDFLSGKGK